MEKDNSGTYLLGSCLLVGLIVASIFAGLAGLALLPFLRAECALEKLFLQPFGKGGCYDADAAWDATQTDDVTTLSFPINVDTDRLANCLDGYIQGSPLEGLGQVFVQAGQQSNVNPALIVAIAKQESSLGRHVPDKNGYNPFGRTETGGGFKKFSSWEEAIYNEAQYLREKD
jgi:hypothetical protein